MLYMLVKLSCLCILGLAGLSAAACALGTGQPLNPALAGFQTGCDDKPQPCWYGIVPGVTTGDEVPDLIAFAGRGRYAFDDLFQSYTLYYTPPEPVLACTFTFRIFREIVTRIEIALCRRAGVRFGDLAVIWGHSWQAISLPPHDVVSGAYTINVNGWPTIASPVYFVNLLTPPDEPKPFPWHGFVPLWRYCQLEPNYPKCH